jgi:hypothetical protein
MKLKGQRMMKNKIVYLILILILFSVISSFLSTAQKKIQPESISSFDPVFVRGTLFGTIDTPQVRENEYGTLLISFRAIKIFLIGHYYGFGSGPAFIVIKDTDLQLKYGSFPGFKGWYWDNFIFGRYGGS